MPVPVRLASFLGAAGVLLCLAGTLGVWYVEVRMDRARGQLFERIDQSLSNIDGRVVEVQKIAAQSKITIDEVRQRAQELTRKEARDRLAERFDIEARMQKLAAGLQRADLMLDVSQETVQLISQALELGGDFGFPFQADAVDPVLERIADVKNELRTAMDAVARLSAPTAAGDQSGTFAARMEQVATLALRLSATFGTIDSRLDSLQGRLTDAQEAVRAWNAKAHAHLVAAAVGATLFLIWMGAGQVCLWRWGRRP
jgi:hypothetical protein